MRRGEERGGKNKRKGRKEPWLKVTAEAFFFLQRARLPACLPAASLLTSELFVDVSFVYPSELMSGTVDVEPFVSFCRCSVFFPRLLYPLFVVIPRLLAVKISEKRGESSEFFDFLIAVNRPAGRRNLTYWFSSKVRTIFFFFKFPGRETFRIIARESDTILKNSSSGRIQFSIWEKLFFS